MNKIKLFSHTDLDGIGCAVLAYLAFGEDNVDVEYLRENFYKDNDRILISGTGGVGLLTRLSLLENVVKACEMQTPHEFLQKKFNVPVR